MNKQQLLRAVNRRPLERADRRSDGVRRAGSDRGGLGGRSPDPTDAEPFERRRRRRGGPEIGIAAIGRVVLLGLGNAVGMRIGNVSADGGA